MHDGRRSIASTPFAIGVFGRARVYPISGYTTPQTIISRVIPRLAYTSWRAVTARQRVCTLQSTWERERMRGAVASPPARASAFGTLMRARYSLALQGVVRTTDGTSARDGTPSLRASSYRYTSTHPSIKESSTGLVELCSPLSAVRRELSRRIECVRCCRWRARRPSLAERRATFEHRTPKVESSRRFSRRRPSSLWKGAREVARASRDLRVTRCASVR